MKIRYRDFFPPPQQYWLLYCSEIREIPSVWCQFAHLSRISDVMSRTGALPTTVSVLLSRRHSCLVAIAAIRWGIQGWLLLQFCLILEGIKIRTSNFQKKDRYMAFFKRPLL